MISCPNKKLKAWKDLVKVVGEDDAHELWNHYKGMVPNSYYNNSGEFYQLAPVGKSDNLQYQFKAVDKIVNNLDKVIKWSNTKDLDIWKKLQQDLQIPKDQIELLKESEGNTIEEKLASFAANYSYTVEINTAKETFVKGDFNPETGEFGETISNSTKNSQYYSNLTVPGGTNGSYIEANIETPLITPSIKGHAQFATDKGIGWFRSDDKENKAVGWKEEDDFLNSETAQYNPITKDDKVIFGHPTIGKSYLKKQGENRFITLDDDYKDEVNAFVDANRGSETRQEYKGRKPKEYNEFMLALYDRLKKQAAKEGKILFVSNTNILKERMSDFDKVINIPKDEFKKRFDARGATYGFEDWKSDIDATIAKVDKSKVISTTGYLSDLLEGNPKTRRILEVQSDLFQKGRDKSDLTRTSRVRLKKDNVELHISFDKLEQAEKFVNEQSDKNKYEIIKPISNENQFLQLLNKDNNWVTFFIKSILQDSAKKGYEKVMFPSGDTASKVEGHTTLQEFKKQKEDRIKQLEKEKQKRFDELPYVHDELIRTTQKLIDKNIGNKEENIKRLNEYKKQKEAGVDVSDIDNEINTLKQELQRVEGPEGFGALKPIYNFYEITVNNILKKQGYSPKQVTDEFGNTWNEVEVKPEFQDPIFFQLSNLLKDEETVYTDDENGTTISNEVDVELNNKLKSFLKKLGITYEAVEKILTNKGIEATAVTNLFTKIVQVVEGKADITTLPEETAHVFVGLMDKNSLLYKRMYNTITKYEVYQEVLRDYADTYNNDEVKLREEAIGKLIAAKIIQQNDSQDTLELNNSFGKWWNSIWQRIKDLFTSVKDDPFVEVANKILTEDTAGLKKSGENENFYQLTNTLTPEQSKILNLIDEDQKKLVLVQNEKERYYTYEGERTGKSVTTRIDEKLDKNYAEKTPEQKAKFKLSSDYGTAAHSDLENAGRRILAKENVAKVVVTNQPTYTKIEKYLTEFKKQFPEGTQYRFEIRVYDKRKSEPGTIDLLVVEPSGLTHTFDYKNTTFSKQEKEVYGEPATYKLKSWNLKVARYSSILRDNYNVTNFGKRRAIPTEFLYKQDSIKGVKLGSPTYSDKEEYLNPVPLLEENVLPKSNSREDIENADKINTLLNQLRKLYTDTEKIKTKDPVQRELLYQKLVKLRKAIKSLQLDTNFDKFIDAGATELSYIEQRLKDKDNPVTPAEVSSFYETSNAFSSLSDSLIHLLMDKTIDKKLQEELMKLELKAKQTKNALKEKFKNIIFEEALAIGETDPFTAQKKASNYFKNINQINHPLFRIFWNLVNKKKIQTRKEIESLEGKITKAVKNLEKWAGTTSIDKFKHLINGKNLISKFSPEYYKLREKAYKNKDIDWLKNNSTIDKEGLEKFLEKKEKEIKAIKHSSNKKENDKKIQESLKRLNESYNVFKYPKAYLYEKNGFIKPINKWQSEEYKFIYKSGNEPLKEFYELFTKTIRDLGEHLPVDIKGTFIPEIEESLIEAIFNSGIGSISGLGDRITDSFKIKSTPGYGEVNEFTGEIERNVPIYYVRQAEKKSMDLGKSLALFAQMALNYKHMSEIEGTVITLKHALQDDNLSREYVTNTFSQVARDESGKFKTTKTSLGTLDAFNDFMNYYLYDVRTKAKDIPLTKTSIDENGEVVTTTYSLNKGIAKTLSAYSMTSLTLNVISGGANLVGGISNVMMQASRGRYFTNKNVLKSAALLTSNNEKAYKLIEYFNIMGEQKIGEKIKKLSSSKIAANVTTNKFYFLQHTGDWLVQNTTLLSMLQGHTIDKGKIVGLKKIANGKSLLDLAEIKDGKITIPGITDEEFDVFRTKTQRLAENILGMSTRDNVARYRLTLMGQIFGQFRNWMPRMAEERFGGISYDYDLETLTKGKYISFVQQVVNKRALPLIKELITGYGPASEARALELFEKELAANPDLAGKLTFEEFKQMHLENLNAMKTELIIIGTFLATFLLAKVGDDDDKDKTVFEKQLTKLWSRSLNELTFFVNPSSFKQIMKTSAPIIGLLDNITNLFYDTFKYWTGVGIDNEEWIKEAKPLKRLKRVFPVTNAIDRWFEE